MTGTDRFSIDIETIPTVETPDFDNPSHWNPFAVAVGYQSPSMTTPDVDVIFREDSSVDAEAQLFNDVIDWISSRSDGNGRVLLTYNGESYDLPILRHRTRQVDDNEPEVNVTQRLDLLLETSTHRDLILDMREREGYWVPLDDALDQHGIEADSPTWLGKTVEGSDMPSMGLELLSGRENPELRETVTRYAASDVAPLFELHDSLCGRVNSQ